MTFDIEAFRVPILTPEQHREKVERDANIFGADYSTEKEASALVRGLLDAQVAEQNWSYEEQVKTKSGKAIDYVVTADHPSYEDIQIQFGIEVKRHLSPHWQFKDGLSATTLADHLEQAAAYSRDLEMPVFIGPFQLNRSPSSMYTGGIKVDSVCALNIFGGRMNVGTLTVTNNDWHPWFLTLRGSTFWEEHTGFNPKRLNIVTSTGSAKERTELWK